MGCGIGRGDIGRDDYYCLLVIDLKNSNLVIFDFFHLFKGRLPAYKVLSDMASNTITSTARGGEEVVRGSVT